ncbi:MAG TPA: AGE family epimerase/isomerase [Phycicoccus sp.]|nr:AGE family epimerase/isomerase [Phycicoccus sp.]
MTLWLDSPTHRAWLERGFNGVIAFVSHSPLPEGGFAWLDAAGQPMTDKRPQLFLTARMTHVAAIAEARGIPGSGALLDHGIDSLLSLHRDREHGGWFTEPGTVTRKSAYDHVHVGLAAASARRVGHPRAMELWERAVEVIDTHLWDDRSRTLRESFAPDWSDEEDYRGANANMHGVEAFLAMGDASGEVIWHDRAYAIAARLINSAARAHNWLLPEHYTGDWAPVLDYNARIPDHPFRPFGVTPGHLLEWARLVADLHTSPVVPHSPWLVEAATALSRTALDDLWEVDHRPGLVYTVDFAGKPVSRLRLHWPVCEAIQTCATLFRITGDVHWARWYERVWDHAARYFIDERGTWLNALDEQLRPSDQVWPGRPDVYHCSGALLAGLGPSWPSPSRWNRVLS